MFQTLRYTGCLIILVRADCLQGSAAVVWLSRKPASSTSDYAYEDKLLTCRLFFLDYAALS